MGLPQARLPCQVVRQQLIGALVFAMQAAQRLACVFRAQRGAQRLQVSALLFQQFDLDTAASTAVFFLRPGAVRYSRAGQCQAGQDGVVRGMAQGVDARLRSQAQRLPRCASLALGAAQCIEPTLVCLELPRLFQQHVTDGEQDDEQQELEQVAAEKAQQGREKSAQWSTEGGSA